MVTAQMQLQKGKGAILLSGGLGRRRETSDGAHEDCATWDVLTTQSNATQLNAIERH